MKGLIKDIIIKRKIPFLVHFTRVENLKSIFENGLVPREYIDKGEIEGLTNDIYRYDNCIDANCISISFPNYKMFYSLRNKDKKTKWCVLVLNTNVLLDLKCAFCYSNAGSNEISKISIEDRMKVEAFEEMFSDRSNYPSRSETEIYAYYPTNPQAEVLVFNIIEPKYIYGIAFEDNKIMKEYLNMVPNRVTCKVKSKYFSYRRDWKYWK